jgi:hypothetical protein
MSAEAIAATVGLGVYVLLRIVDYLLPKGRHFRFVNRYSEPDEPEKSNQ